MRSASDYETARADASQPLFPLTAARLEEWRANPDALGILLVGSKSRGHDDEMSDDDLEVVLTNEAHARLKPEDCSEHVFEGEGEERRLIYDAQYVSLASLKGKAASARDLDHWPYEAARVLFDRDGSVAEAAEAAARMTADFRSTRLTHATIDAGVAAKRAAKALKRGREAAARLLVARGAKALARILFALEWRWVPLDHWLEEELRTLSTNGEAARGLLEALRTCRAEPLASALASLEDRLASEGVPRPDARLRLFLDLLHPSRARERATHGLD